MIDSIHSICLIAIMSILTAALRFLPFCVFRKHQPEVISYLGKFLPNAIMAILLVYCLRNMEILNSPYGLPEIISLGIVFILHKWKHNSLVSIGLGTIIYMVLLNFMS